MTNSTLDHKKECTLVLVHVIKQISLGTSSITNHYHHSHHSPKTSVKCLSLARSRDTKLQYS